MKGLVPASERKAVVVGITQQNPGKNLYSTVLGVCIRLSQGKKKSLGSE